MRFVVISGLNIETAFLKKFDLQHGYGYGRKAELIAKKLINKNIDCVISFGFAGGINNTIKTGDLIIGENIIWQNKSVNKTSKEFVTFFKKKLEGVDIKIVNVLCSSSIISIKNNQKLETPDYLLQVVDMESEYIQKVALKFNVPFICLRVIFDDLKNQIPDFIKQLMRDDGKINIKGLFIEIFRNPIRIFEITKLSIIYFISIQKLKKVSKLIFKN